ncbi:MAG TPA: penicillin-binding transpeptidase domain-containing protein, partial [Hyphomicrobiaceae bacterium]|nr:penicillin-binding transpeptidase domain-containing protein [Hyphomicrobiaceae bacterium]
KPLIYALAFELGILHPETLIEDRPARFGSYSPKNFDEEFHGTVTIREALAASLNIPAVKVIERIGPQRVTAALRRAGLTPHLPGSGEPSLAIALGGIGLKLHDLAQLFAAIARG